MPGDLFWPVDPPPFHLVTFCTWRMLPRAKEDFASRSLLYEVNVVCAVCPCACHRGPLQPLSSSSNPPISQYPISFAYLSHSFPTITNTNLQFTVTAYLPFLFTLATTIHTPCCPLSAIICTIPGPPARHPLPLALVSWQGSAIVWPLCSSMQSFDDLSLVKICDSDLFSVFF